MAYCDSCGAYIPDGQSVCLACGLDSAAEKPSSAAASASASASASAAREEYKEKTGAQSGSDAANYYSFTNEELKERLAQQRKKQQEDSRRWAEEQKARREHARQHAGDSETQSGASPKSGTRTGITGSKSGDGKLFGALSYLGILFLLPMLLCKDDELASFHARQGLGLFIFGLAARFLGFVPYLGVALKLFRYYCIYRGMSSAIKGTMEELPYIGRFFRWK